MESVIRRKRKIDQRKTKNDPKIRTGHVRITIQERNRSCQKKNDPFKLITILIPKDFLRKIIITIVNKINKIQNN